MNRNSGTNVVTFGIYINAQVLLHTDMLTLVEAVVPSSWMMCRALGLNVHLSTAPMTDPQLTVVTMKMLVFAVNVSGW